MTDLDSPTHIRSKVFSVVDETISVEFHEVKDRLLPVEVIFKKSRPAEEQASRSSTTTATGYKSCVRFDVSLRILWLISFKSFPDASMPQDVLDRKRGRDERLLFTQLDKDESDCMQDVRNSVRQIGALVQV